MGDTKTINVIFTVDDQYLPMVDLKSRMHWSWKRMILECTKFWDEQHPAEKLVDEDPEQIEIIEDMEVRE